MPGLRFCDPRLSDALILLAPSYTNDASGRNTFLTGQRWTPSGYVPTSTTSDFDGDGKRIRETSDSLGYVTTTYYLRSSVLGGVIVEELNSSGQKQLGYVFTPAAGLLARQAPGNDYVSLKQVSPIGASQYEFSFSSTMSESISRREFDPVGASVPLNNHTSLGHGGAAGDIPGGGGASDSRFSALQNPGAGCVVDGVYTPCDWIGRMLSSGSLALAITSGGKTTKVDIQDLGAGIYGAWHRGTPGSSGNSSNEIDNSRDGEFPLLRTNNRGDDTVGHWELLNIGFTLPQNSGTNPFPTLSKDNLKVVQDSIKLAQEMTKSKKCDEALKAYGIPSLAALINGMTPNSNVFDGRTSTLTGAIGKNGATESVAAYFKENKAAVGAAVFNNSVTGRGSVTFLGDYFFNPASTDWVAFQRAIIIMHESVHQVGGKGDAPFGSSKQLSEKIIENCYPVLKGKLGGVG